MLLFLVFIKHDIRDDLKKFLDEHDKKDRERSQRRFSRMSEKQKRRQSIAYRRGSSKTPTNPTVNPDTMGPHKEKPSSPDKLNEMNEFHGIENPQYEDDKINGNNPAENDKNDSFADDNVKNDKPDDANNSSTWEAKIEQKSSED